MSLRAVIAGCGPRGLEHAAAIRETEGLQLSGMADPAAEARAQAEAAHGVPTHADLAGLIAATEPQIVVVATPPFAHEEPVQTAAEAPSVVGVLVEKPFALQLAAAERMIEGCDTRGTLLAVGHHMRYTPHFVAMKEAIDAGEIGEVEFLRGTAFGDLVDQGSHLIDAMRWLLGDPAVLWVMSQRGDRAAGRLPGATHAGDGAWIPAWTTHHLAFEGGARGSLETGPLHQRSRAFVDEWLDKRITVTGSEGIAECVTGGDCRILSADGSGWRVVPGGMRSNRAATMAQHEALRDAVQGRGELRTDAHRILPSFEGVLACAQSVVDGDAVYPPLGRDRDPISALVGSAPVHDDPLRGPSVQRVGKAVVLSVIVPLLDHRGYALESIGALVRDQTLDRSRFEVIAASNGSDPELDREVEALLGDQDRLITHPGFDETALYDAGAREARGELLWMTEAHAIAEPQALDELVAYMARTDYDGACCRSIGITANALAFHQEVFYEEGFEQWTEPGEWSRVIFRGFAIYRDVYFSVGGFELSCGRFAEHAMAARLHRHGRQLGYAAGCAVRHANTTNYPLLIEEVSDFAAGEIRYRAAMPAEYCDRYFGTPPEWAERRSLDRAAARAAVGLSLRRLARARSPRVALPMLAALRGNLSTALLGPGPRIFRARLGITAARIRCALWRPISRERAQRAYKDAYEAIVHWSRVRELARLAGDRSGLEPATGFEVAALPEDHLFGFYGPEQAAGGAFRWSRPVAFCDLPVPPGSYRVILDTLGLRDGEQLGLGVFFNDRPVPAALITSDAAGLSFSVSAADFGPGEQRLAISCTAIRPGAEGSADDRVLGLPLSRIEFEPAVESVS